MTTILINIKPFVFDQEVYVIGDEEVSFEGTIKMKDLISEIFALSEKYNTVEFHISGAKVFTKGLKQKIQKEELNKYSENKLNITLI